MAGLLVLLLAGCATGQARDAERGAREAATEGGRFPGLQATTSARVLGGTPPPATPQPPRPVVVAMALSRQVGSDGAPQGTYSAFPTNAGTVYVAAQIANLQPDQTVFAQWETSRVPAERGGLTQEEVVGYAEGPTPDRPSPAWVALPLDLNGSLETGDYAVTVGVFVPAEGEDAEEGAVEAVPLGSLAFQITASGTSPRQIDG